MFSIVTSSVIVASRFMRDSKFDLDEFKIIPSSNDDGWFLIFQYLENHAKFLDIGSSRSVYDIGNELVLKLSANTDQNQKESSRSKCLGSNLAFARVHDVSPDFRWIIMDKASPVSDMALLTALNKILSLPNHLRLVDGEHIRRLLETYLDIQRKGYNPYKPSSTRTRTMQDVVDGCQFLSSNPSHWWKDLISGIQNCGINTDDFGKTSNWGLIGQRPVIIDYGW